MGVQEVEGVMGLNGEVEGVMSNGFEWGGRG